MPFWARRLRRCRSGVRSCRRPTQTQVAPSFSWRHFRRNSTIFTQALSLSLSHKTYRGETSNEMVIVEYGIIVHGDQRDDGGLPPAVSLRRPLDNQPPPTSLPLFRTLFALSLSFSLSRCLSLFQLFPLSHLSPACECQSPSLCKHIRPGHPVLLFALVLNTPEHEKKLSAPEVMCFSTTHLTEPLPEIVSA